MISGIPHLLRPELEITKRGEPVPKRGTDAVMSVEHGRGVGAAGIGRESGVVVERRHYALWTLRGGKVLSLRVYLDRAEALEAVGPAE